MVNTDNLSFSHSFCWINCCFFSKKINPKTLNLINAAGLKSKAKDYLSAISILEQVVEIDDQDFNSYYNLACLYSLVNDKEKSIDFLKKALKRGYRNFDKLRTDEDLKWIRGFSEFENEILSKIKRPNQSKFIPPELETHTSALYVSEGSTKKDNDNKKIETQPTKIWKSVSISSNLNLTSKIIYSISAFLILLILSFVLSEKIYNQTTISETWLIWVLFITIQTWLQSKIWNSPVDSKITFYLPNVSFLTSKCSLKQVNDSKFEVSKINKRVSINPRNKIYENWLIFFSIVFNFNLHCLCVSKKG